MNEARGYWKEWNKVVKGGQTLHNSIYLMYLKENSEKQRVEGWFQELGGGWQRECLLNGDKIFDAGWKSSRDKLKNTVHWINRPDWTLQSLRGKAGLKFLHPCLEAPPLSDSSRTGCGMWVQPEAPCRRSLPSTGGHARGGKIHSEALIGKGLNEGSSRVMNHDQSKCYKTY